MIRLDGISRTFLVGDQAVYALSDITEHVRAGEYIALMGPSGSGKSTLLNVLGCLDRPTAGTYRLDGEDVGALDDAALTEIRRHKVGFVFQAYHLVPRLDAAGNVELPLIFDGVARSERRRRCAEALAAVGLSDRARHRPHQLSGGQRQRVAIARATILGPRLLLADEPTGNLDSAAGDQVLGVLKNLNEKGITLVVVTHDPHVARQADRILVLHDGRIARRMESEALTDMEHGTR